MDVQQQQYLPLRWDLSMDSINSAFPAILRKSTNARISWVYHWAAAQVRWSGGDSWNPRNSRAYPFLARSSRLWHPWVHRWFRFASSIVAFERASHSKVSRSSLARRVRIPSCNPSSGKYENATPCWIDLSRHCRSRRSPNEAAV